MKEISKRGAFVCRYIALLLITSHCFAVDLSGNEITAEWNTASGERILLRQITQNPPVWCGESHLVLDSESGPVILDLSSGIKRKIDNSRYVGATSCSPDGQWLILVDVRTGSPEFIRFNMLTGSKEPIAFGYGGRFSPDGKKILFSASSQSKKSIKYSNPQWEFYWMHEWPAGSGGKAVWLADSSGLILGNKGTFYLQREQKIEPLKLTLRPNLENSALDIFDMVVDVHGGLYVLAKVIDNTVKGVPKRLSRRLFKCVLDRDRIDCKGITSATVDVLGFDVSTNGNKLVYTDSSKCLNQFNLGLDETRCIAKNVSWVVSISPDAQNVVYSRFREKGKSGVVTADAYMIPLK